MQINTRIAALAVTALLSFPVMASTARADTTTDPETCTTQVVNDDGTVIVTCTVSRSSWG